MRCRVFVIVALGACAPKFGPGPNEALHKDGRHVVSRTHLTTGTFCKTCGRDAPVMVRFGDKVEVAIPNCYAHAESKVGDHDAIHIELLDSHAVATAGELDIVDCTTSHVVAKLWATFPDGTRVDAQFDTALVEP